MPGTRALGGGEGSGKSHFFAEALVERHIMEPGMRSVGIREVQKSLAQSSKLLIESKIRDLGVSDQFEVQRDVIKAPGGGLIMFCGMQDHTADSIKSLEGCKVAWIEEASNLSERSLTLLRPTIRVEGSEIWASWNPVRKTDAIDVFLRQKPPENAVVVRANWSDNPWWTDTLELERLHDLETYPDRYSHVWDGDYVQALEGAYFARMLADAREEGRIGPSPGRDGFLPVRLFWDIGGAGRGADALAVWAVQFVGPRIHVLDYIETQGQTLDYVISEIKERGWGGCDVDLPHDGANVNSVSGKTYADHVRAAGFKTVRVHPNVGTGAAMLRIRAVQRLFPRIWFDKVKCEAGLDALGWYHEKRDDKRGIGLGPEHDWSSHGADAFGLMALCHNEHLGTPVQGRRAYKDREASGGSSWAV